MPPWRSHLFEKAAREHGVHDETIARATASARFLYQRTPNAPPIFTLRHLSHLTGVPYHFVRQCVERREPEPYRLFRIRKRKVAGEQRQRYRIICVPDPRLMTVQRWINTNVLNLVNAHPASVAFSKGSNIKSAAHSHCGCRWLIKMDIVNFFESISEHFIFHVFNGAGFQPLMAFELARLCTRLGKPSYARQSERWSNTGSRSIRIAAYLQARLGHLPQGAPTSPRLANLAMRNLDQEISRISSEVNLVYTRYADDLTLSTGDPRFSRCTAKLVVSRVYASLRRHGLEPNLTKTKIIPPGGRKVVLGLLVDGEEPRLTKAFRDRLRQHLHYMQRDDVGPVRHAEAQGLQSVYGLRNHVRGMIAHAAQIDREFADRAWQDFGAVKWP